MRKTAALSARAALLCALLPAAHAHAQDSAPREPIVVTGRGLGETPATPAYSTNVIDRDALESSASDRIEDILARVAGFQQFRRSDSRSANPSAQGVTLRALGGNATSRALVLLDGVPMADPFFGYIPLSAIAPERLARVRVTRGGGSGAFGAGAVSGTIELESAGPAVLDRFSAAMLIDNRGESTLSALAAPRLGAGFAALSGRWDRGAGFRTTPASQRVPASARAGYESWSAALRTVTPLAGQTELQFGALLFDDGRTLRFRGARSTSTGQDASLRLVHRGAWQFDALAYVQARDFSNVVISSTRFVRTLDQRATPSTGRGGKLEVRPPVGGDGVLRLGADLRIASGHTEEEAYSAVTGQRTSIRRAGGRTRDLGLYAEGDWALGALVLTGGLRADRWSVTGGNFRVAGGSGTPMTLTRFADRAGWTPSLRGGILWRASPALSLRAAAYTGLRQPTLNELYRPFIVFPVETRANAALANERLEGFEAGFDLVRGETAALSLTAFDNRLKNAIANVTIGPDLRERRNVDSIRARGIEATARLHRGPWSLDGSLAWTRARVKASGAGAALNGKRPAQVPALAASATLAWEPREGWRISATLRHIGRQFEDDLETDILPPATTLDGVAHLPLGGAFALVLRGENLTNERIVTRNQGGSIDLGVPRTLWIGLKLRAPR